MRSSDHNGDMIRRRPVSQSPLPRYPHDDEKHPSKGREKNEHMVEIVEVAAANLAIAYSSSLVL